MENDPIPTVEQLVEMGYNRPVAEALNGRDLKMSYVQTLSPIEAFEEYLIWEGMSGRARTLIRAYESCVNAASLGRGDFGFDLPEDAR